MWSQKVFLRKVGRKEKEKESAKNKKNKNKIKKRDIGCGQFVNGAGSFHVFLKQTYAHTFGTRMKMQGKGSRPQVVDPQGKATAAVFYFREPGRLHCQTRPSFLGDCVVLAP